MRASLPEGVFGGTSAEFVNVCVETGMPVVAPRLTENSVSVSVYTVLTQPEVLIVGGGGE